MSRLLQTRLPIEMEEVVTPDTYNRLVRVLEINLGEFDTDNIRQIDDTTKNIANFNPGSLVWNTNNESLEVYSGNEWITITTPKINKGLSATGSVGEVTLKLAGATSISL
jgi:succinylglutamate desuccinylase